MKQSLATRMVLAMLTACLAGLVLADAEPDDPTLADGLLVCATEVTTPAEIATFAGALAAVLADFDIPAVAEPVR